MMMKKIIFLVSLVCVSSAFSEIKCDNSVLKTEKTYEIPGAGYWMQAFGDCRITYTSVGGISSKMYNMCTNSAEPITNRIDAYGLPEGDIYTHPGAYGIEFYKTSDLLLSGAQTRPFFQDAHPGDYQSIGILSKSGNERKIRIAMGSAGGSIKDYVIKKKGDDFEIKAVQSEPLKICRNIPSAGLDRQVPILSRDGKYIAGRDNGTRVMKIYKINDRNGDCEFVNEIPAVTSKVSFSFDKKNVIFVVNDPNTRKGRLLQMNIESGEVITLSSPTENVQYMTSTEKGEILYSRKSDSGSGATSTLVKLSPSLIPKANSSDSKSYEAIGLMWAKNCNMQIDLDYALAVGQRLTDENCNAIVKDGDLKSLDAEYSNLKTDEVKKVCSVSAGSAAKTSGSAGPAATGQ